MGVGAGGERMLLSHGGVVPALLLAEMHCTASPSHGERGGSQVLSFPSRAAESTAHPASRCWY